MRALLLTVAASLAACSARVAPAPAADPVPLPPPEKVVVQKKPETRKESALLRRIAQVLDQTAALRELPAKRPVVGAVLSRPDLLAQLKAHVLKEVPLEAIVREGNAMKLAGVIPKDIDYQSIMFRLLEEQLAGFYSPEDETMSLAGDLDEEMADATLLHELVHALQDQYFDLKPGAKYKPGQSDRSFARSALAEGDATSAMTDFMTGHVGGKRGVPSEQVENTITLAMQSSMPDFAPVILQKSLISPYVNGLRFVNALRRRGGWQAVDATWKNPPVTSEQILHFEKYLAHEPELAVAPPAAASVGAGYVLDDADTSGEEGMRLMFESWLGHKKGTELARGWGGDRSAMVHHESSGAIAIVEHLRYDADARAQALLLARAVGKAWGVTETRSTGAGSDLVAFCKERPDLGPAAVVTKRAGAPGDVVFVFGPTKADGWVSQGTCAAALATARLELDR